MPELLVWHRLVVGQLAANCYIVGCTATGDALVVDPGDDGPHVVAALAKHGLTARMIVDTHGHFDHTGANGAVKAATGAELAIHVDDAPLLERQEQHAASFGVVVPPSPKPDRLLVDGDVLHVGELSFEVIHTPGHSPGGICLFFGDIVLVGDTLFAGSIGRTDLPGGNHHTLIDSIRTRLLPLGDRVRVLPGHCETTTIGAERATNPFLTSAFV